jgi:hypothetical protein
MFGFKPLIKEKYDYLTSTISKKNENAATTKIIGQQDIIEFRGILKEALFSLHLIFLWSLLFQQIIGSSIDPIREANYLKEIGIHAI